MYTSVDQAVLIHKMFDTAHICTPNFTHFDIASKVAPCSKIVFIEKPGVSNSFTWQRLLEEYKYTRFIMVKNNMWRDNISELKESAARAKTVKIKWIRKNCIPSPGSWFTTKKLAYGGVSRDLMPHMLSWYVVLDDNWGRDTVTRTASQHWQLDQIDSTDYGTINPDGTYDVDDVCTIKFGDKWTLSANWRSMDQDQRNIEFVMQDDSIETFELGLCPEYAYKEMIRDAVANLNNDKFWKNQYNQDTWIHQLIENV